MFNYDFNSVDKVSPVVNAALGALREAEHRSTFYFPYWKIPGLGAEWPIPPLVPRQLKFQNDMKLLRGVLDEVILNVIEDKDETDMDALINKDYSKIKDPSLLRFLVDVRGADATQKQLRDDLITLLIAGHETTGSMLTWATWLLSQYPEAQAKMQEEIDRVLGDRIPTYDDMQALEQVPPRATSQLRESTLRQDGGSRGAREPRRGRRSPRRPRAGASRGDGDAAAVPGAPHPDPARAGRGRAAARQQP